MSMILRLAGAVLLICCGWCAGGAVQAKFTSHENALHNTVQLLRRIRQEIACRRVDLNSLCRQLCREGLLLQPGDTLQALAPPQELTAQETACFAACMAGLGRTSAQQECERLDYYIQRFEEFLRAAQQQTQAHFSLSRKLGLAAGAVAALLLI